MIFEICSNKLTNNQHFIGTECEFEKRSMFCHTILHGKQICSFLIVEGIYNDRCSEGIYDEQLNGDFTMETTVITFNRIHIFNSRSKRTSTTDENYGDYFNYEIIILVYT